MSTHATLPGIPFASPLEVSSPSETSWYHYMDWPDGSTTRGKWDYRGKVDAYLGHQDLAGKSVLEIGPASGFLTKEMEARGATVTCIDTADDDAWDVVPRKDVDAEAYRLQRKSGIHRFRKAWWLTRQRFGGRAQIAYCGAAALERVVGRVRFDVALLGCVLQHFRDPVDVLYNRGARILHDHRWARNVRAAAGRRVASSDDAEERTWTCSWSAARASWGGTSSRRCSMPATP